MRSTTLYAAHDSITGIIDIAMVSSLGKLGEISDIVKNYGMVIMDECHHGAALTVEAVLREVNAKYVYGLTATPKRDDGLEQKVNGIRLECTDNELVDVGIHVADGSMDYEALLAWVREHRS